MPEHSAPSRRSLATFSAALFAGLLWGISAVAAISAAAMVIAILLDGTGSTGVHQIIETAAWAALVASILAIFPVGPLAGIVGWQLYHRGVVAPWAYAGVGALSALLAPVVILFSAVETMRYETTNFAVIEPGVIPLLAAAVATVGAFGGFMAGRAIRSHTVQGR